MVLGSKQTITQKLEAALLYEAADETVIQIHNRATEVLRLKESETTHTHQLAVAIMKQKLKGKLREWKKAGTSLNSVVVALLANNCLGRFDEPVRCSRCVSNPYLGLNLEGEDSEKVDTTSEELVVVEEAQPSFEKPNLAIKTALEIKSFVEQYAVKGARRSENNGSEERMSFSLNQEQLKSFLISELLTLLSEEEGFAKADAPAFEGEANGPRVLRTVLSKEGRLLRKFRERIIEEEKHFKAPGGARRQGGNSSGGLDDTNGGDSNINTKGVCIRWIKNQFCDGRCHKAHKCPDFRKLKGICEMANIAKSDEELRMMSKNNSGKATIKGKGKKGGKKGSGGGWGKGAWGLGGWKQGSGGGQQGQNANASSQAAFQQFQEFLAQQQKEHPPALENGENGANGNPTKKTKPNKLPR